jgi:hypothetical protein
VSNYGISIGSGGALTGYAWSDNIGWVSADHTDVAYCESNYGGGDPQIQSNGQLTGWLRALAGNTAQSGGWDGCISLSGTNYGVTVASGGAFSGYAWGDITVGWTDFPLVKESSNPTCPVGYVTQGESCIFSSCPADFTQETDQSGNPKCILNSCSIGYTLENNQCVYTGCPDGYSLEGSQCVLTGPAAPAGDIAVVPSLVQPGNQTSVLWSATDVSSCTIDGSNGDSWSCGGESCNATTSESSSPINSQVVYTLSCTGDDYLQLTRTATVNIVPSFEER